MKKGDIILLTTGAGQYYHVAGVAIIAKYLSAAESDMMIARLGKYRNREKLQALIMQWVNDGLICSVDVVEINCDQTRHEKITISGRNADSGIIKSAFVDESCDELQNSSSSKSCSNKKDEFWYTGLSRDFWKAYRENPEKTVRRRALAYANEINQPTAVYNHDNKWYWNRSNDSDLAGRGDITHYETIMPQNNPETGLDA